VLKSEDVEKFLEQSGIQGQILRLEDPTPTVELAARAVGATPERIVKSILFLVEGEPVLAITCGTDRVDRRAIASQYGVGRKKVKLAPPERVLEETGYEVGTLPPFAHRQPIPTLLDRRVLDQPEIYAGGGGERALLRIMPQDILAAARAQVVDLTSPPE
jgi:Cys-tRNA(Pro) deacylase